MKTVKMEKLPKCDFCDENTAMYDAPTPQGRWGYACSACAVKHGLNLTIGSKLEQRTPAKPKDDDKIVVGKCITSLEDQVYESVREIKCPSCGKLRSVESDANYTFTCEGCGIKVKCPEPFC